MAIIQSDNKTHAATCATSEGSRQNDVAQAVIAGGGSATVAAAVKTAEVAHYRRVIVVKRFDVPAGSVVIVASDEA